MKIVNAFPFVTVVTVVRSRSIVGSACRVQPMVIANDHYQSIGIVCQYSGGVQRAARKRSIGFNLHNK